MLSNGTVWRLLEGGGERQEDQKENQEDRKRDENARNSPDQLVAIWEL